MRRRPQATASRAGRNGRALRLAMRLLHARFRRLDVRGLLPRQLQGAVAGERPIVRQSLPLHRLPANPGCRGRGARPAPATSRRCLRPAAHRAGPAAGRAQLHRGRVEVLPPHVAARALHPARDLSGGPARRRRHRDRGGVEQEVQGIPAAHLNRSRARADAPHRDPRGLAHRRGGHADEHRGGTGRRVPVGREDAAGVCRPPDSQPRHARRQPGDRVAHRRLRPRAADARGQRRADHRQGRPHGGAGRFLHRLPPDRPQAR